MDEKIGIKFIVILVCLIFIINCGNRSVKNSTNKEVKENFSKQTNSESITKDYKERIDNLMINKDYQAIDQLLIDWNNKGSNDPQFFISKANYLFSKSKNGGINISKGAAKDKDGIEMINQKTGEKYHISSESHYDKKLVNEAKKTLEKAVELFPQRLDIRFGLIYLCQESSDFSFQFDLMEKTIKYARINSNNLRWENNTNLPKDASEMILGTYQDYSKYYYEQETLEGDEKFLKLSVLMADSFPNKPLPFNNIAQYYYQKKDFNKSLGYLLKAHEIDKTDVLVIMNIADLYMKLNNKEDSIKFYEEAIKLNTDPEFVEEAKQKLKTLK